MTSKKDSQEKEKYLYNQPPIQIQTSDSSSRPNPTRKKASSFSERMFRLKMIPWGSPSKLANSLPTVVSITYEEIGLFPRSFSRVFDRFIKQVFSDVENLVIQEYRFYRYLFITTLKCLFFLIFIPLLVNFIAKLYLVQPLTEYFWNTKQTEIFLNTYQQKRAFTEFEDFEEKLYFESLQNTGEFWITAVKPQEIGLGKIPGSIIPRGMSDPKSDKFLDNSTMMVESSKKLNRSRYTLHSSDSVISIKKFQNLSIRPNESDNFKKIIEERLQQKTLELAIRYNTESIEAITNFFADLLSLITLCCLFFVLEIQINITKSFLLEVFFGLDDSKKSLIILLVTDLLVGYHSSNLWELFFQFWFNHYGLPENQTGIFLLVATFPVLLDVLFKYLIFRHLNRASPATVATYHAMIE